MSDLFKATSTMLWVRGVLGILFGLAAMAWPGLTAAAFAVIWGAYALIDGIMMLLLAFSSGLSTGQRVWSGLVGLLGLFAGIVAIFNPFASAAILAWVLGIWLIAHGITEIIGAFGADHEGSKWLEVLSGVLWIIAGILFVMNPIATAVTLAIWFGALALVWGIFSIVAGFMVRKTGKEATSA